MNERCYRPQYITAELLPIPKLIQTYLAVCLPFFYHLCAQISLSHGIDEVRVSIDELNICLEWAEDSPLWVSELPIGLLLIIHHTHIHTHTHTPYHIASHCIPTHPIIAQHSSQHNIGTRHTRVIISVMSWEDTGTRHTRVIIVMSWEE